MDNWYREDKLNQTTRIMHDESQKVPSDFLENLSEYDLTHLSDPRQPQLGWI